LGLDAHLLEARVNPEVMLGLGNSLVDGDLQLLPGFIFNHPDNVGIYFARTRLNPDGARRTHPI
jgi:hypothetical protein